MLDPKKLGLSGGIVCGFFLFITTLFAIWLGYGTEYLQKVESLYPGYAITYVGSLIGLVYGFVKGFIGFYLLAWIYNRV